MFREFTPFETYRWYVLGVLGVAVVQALLQQKPSTQKVLVHSAPTVHAWPVAKVAHAAPPLQLVAPTHSLSGS